MENHISDNTQRSALNAAMPEEAARLNLLDLTFAPAAGPDSMSGKAADPPALSESVKVDSCMAIMQTEDVTAKPGRAFRRALCKIGGSIIR